MLQQLSLELVLERNEHRGGAATGDGARKELNRGVDGVEERGGGHR
jgi:hypothetical protein